MSEEQIIPLRFLEVVNVLCIEHQFFSVHPNTNSFFLFVSSTVPVIIAMSPIGVSY